MILQEPIDDIQMICLKLREMLTQGLDEIEESIRSYEMPPYEPEPERWERWSPPPALQSTHRSAEPIIWQADDPLLRPRAWFR